MSGRRDTFVIARRELLERIASKWFVLMTLLGPAFMVALVVVPALIASKGTAGARIEIIDHTGEVGAVLVERRRAHDWVATVVPPTTPEQVELDRIRDDQINGFLVVPAGGLDEGLIVYRGDNATSQVVQAYLTRDTTQVVLERRADKHGLTSSQKQAMLAPVHVVPLHSTGDAQGSSGLGAFFIAYILAFILYMVITLYGVNVMRSVVQEKTSRVMEFLVAAVKPSSLMAGKILGVGGAAMIQLTVWLGIGALALAYRAELLALFGAPGGGVSLPALAFTEIGIVLAYFVLGFFFYSAMYAAVGAMVSSDQDTQQVQVPVTMMLL